jgi:hypothetical protein
MWHRAAPGFAVLLARICDLHLKVHVKGAAGRSCGRH